MTNEEKIEELAFKAFPKNIGYSTIIEEFKDYNAEKRDYYIQGAKDIIEWKEQQMINKAVEILIDANAVGFGLCSCDFTKAFKKAMEE